MSHAETVTRPPPSSCCAAPSSAAIPEDLPSAVAFAHEQRPHISINVKDVRASLPFYVALFNGLPTKMREDYAKWETEDPPVNLSINQHPESAGRNGHFGIEVKTTDQVEAYRLRLRQLSIPIEATEKEVACCYSVQTKIWATDPDENHWEIFVVTEAEAEQGCEATCICYNPATGNCDWK